MSSIKSMSNRAPDLNLRKARSASDLYQWMIVTLSPRRHLPNQRDCWRDCSIRNVGGNKKVRKESDEDGGSEETKLAGAWYYVQGAERGDMVSVFNGISGS
jgi:hypothetical protein